MGGIATVSDPPTRASSSAATDDMMQELPNELLVHICAFLLPRELGRLACASRNFSCPTAWNRTTSVYRIQIKTACHAGAETSSNLVGSFRPGDQVVALKETVNSADARQIFVCQRRVGCGTDGALLRGWISKEPSIVEEMDDGCGDASDMRSVVEEAARRWVVAHPAGATASAEASPPCAGSHTPWLLRQMQAIILTKHPDETFSAFYARKVTGLPYDAGSSTALLRPTLGLRALMEEKDPAEVKAARELFRRKAHGVYDATDIDEQRAFTDKVGFIAQWGQELYDAIILLKSINEL